MAPSNLPNLRRLFVEARSEAEESAYSRKASQSTWNLELKKKLQFYNLAIFISSIAAFSLVAQRMTSAKAIGS
ncbi:monooxygenase fad-binding [Pyrenophora seminiperda CCB06]|uniref:Monooxygenase fad-binding n=1 Tax=Pyrenophora seminiperda CCB06 TaxID=1302712 RepID=A0A3M7M556_9PLEO|nr:monooxygenase fad-binding [Pyrenophora seminiperda CCB06]